jgi:hypothetical protein
MGKAIVFCADGTWNGPGEPDADNTSSPPTNVFKLFLNIAGIDEPGTMMLAKEQERVLRAPDGTVLQWTKYLHGVGDASNELVKLLGGGLGAGLIERIVRGYTFISRNYLAGDQIYIIGFSRGAYTARALAGLIAGKGLLDATKNNLADKSTAYRMGTAVWYAYRLKVAQSMSGWLDKLTNLALDLPAFTQQTVPDNLLIAAPIEAVAVWDTVGSLGIPDYTRQDTRLDVFQFADTVLSPMVKHGVHAVAVDERRADFTPTLWQPDGRILQALFPGCHSDVGGGFVAPGIESGLSDAALQWMTERLTALGVRFLDPPAYALHPNPRATAHAPWLSDIWRYLPQGPRIFPPPPGLFLSEEEVARAQPGPVIPDPTLPAVPYAPDNLSAYLVAGVEAPGVTVV